MARSNVNAVLKRKSAGATSPNAWTTPDQTEYLNSQRGAYKAAQAQRRESKDAFWAMVFKHWEETWPLPSLTAEEKAAGINEESRLDKQKERLRQWFNNHTRASASSGSRRKILKLTGNKKKLRATQVYQTLYYEEKIKPIVKDRWEVEWKSKPEYDPKKKIPAPPLRFRNEVTIELWEAESAEVKAIVEEHRNKNDDSNDLVDEEPDDEVDAEEHQRRAKVKRIQSNIEAIPNTVVTLLEEIYKETGLLGCVVLAGPEPMQGGNIFVQSFFHGKSPAGFEFDTTYPTVVKDLEAALTDFATASIPHNVRISRALPGTEHLAASHSKMYLGPSFSSKPLHVALPTTSGSATPKQAAYQNHNNPQPAEKSSTDARKGKQRRDPTPEVTPSPSPGSNIGSSSSEGEEDGHSKPPVDIGGNSEHEKQREVNIARNKQAMLALASDWNMFHQELAQQKIAAERETGKEKKKKSGKGAGVDNGSKGASDPRRSERNVATAAHTSSAAAAADVSSTTAEGETEKRKEKNGMGVGVGDGDSGGASGSEHDVAMTADTSSTAPADGSADADTPSAPPVPTMDRTGWPEWLSTAIDDLITSTSDVLDINLRDMIVKLPILDAKLGFISGTNKACKIDATGRPAIIAKWINAGRKLDAQPVVTNISSYSQEWWKWWAKLQPKSRRSTELLREVHVGETWDECRKGGKNGFYVIVLSLSWWAQAASTSESRANVSKATEDALWVLDRMIDSLTISKKHALDDDLTLSHSKRLRKN